MMTNSNPRIPGKAGDDLPTQMHQPEPARPETRNEAAHPDIPTLVHHVAPSALASAGGAHGLLRPPQGQGEIGRLGPYRVLEVLGAGGMGFVYRAEDSKLQRSVALKVLMPHLVQDADARQRFFREARAAAALKSDYIITIYQVDEDQNIPYLAMEYLEGEGLDRWLKRGGQPTLADVLRIGREIALGLETAHRRGLIHRDIKPGNVWLEKRDHEGGPSSPGRVKILDFGLARAVADDVRLTQSGAILGTPSYMAPEQARGLPIDHRADLFSLGCVLYRLCTGELPFHGDTTIAVLTSLAVDVPRSVRELNPKVPLELAVLVERLLAKHPEERPRSAAEVATALQAIERTAPATEWAPPPPRVEPTTPTPHRLAPPRPMPVPGTMPAASPTPAVVNPLLEELLRRARWNRTMGFVKALVLLAVLGAAGYFFGPLGYRYATDQGLLVVHTSTPNTEVVIRDSRGGLVRQAQAGNITLPTGTWQVEVSIRDNFGVPQTFQKIVTLKRGGTETIDLRSAR